MYQNRPFTIIDTAQRSPEWFAARLARVTASNAKLILMGDTTAGRSDYILQLALESLTGKSAEEEIFVSKEMQRGIDKEPLARMQAESSGHFIRETGFLSHDTMMIGASLDGDEDDFETIWEFKCPKSNTHLKYLESNGDLLQKDYQSQLMHGIYVTGAKQAIIGSFDDRLPEGLQWIQKEIKAQDLPIAEYEISLMKFLDDVQAMKDKLQTMQMR